jgi:hypothetical protein
MRQSGARLPVTGQTSIEIAELSAGKSASGIQRTDCDSRRSPRHGFNRCRHQPQATFLKARLLLPSGRLGAVIAVESWAMVSI